MPKGKRHEERECRNEFCRMARQELQAVEAELERVTLLLEKIQQNVYEALSWPGGNSGN